MTTRSTRLITAAATAVAALVLPGLVAPAPAAGPDLADSDAVTYTTVVTDPDDTDGPLDVARVAHRIRTADVGAAARIAIRVHTHEPFDAAGLHPRRRSLVVELDTDSERGAERNLRISARHGVPVAELISNATREVIARIPMTRPDARTVRVSAGRQLLGARRYFWTATYHRRGSADCGMQQGYPVWCQDSVPDRGWITMDRPAWPEQGRRSGRGQW